MVTRYALYAFGSAYVASLAILAETGQIISFRSQNSECDYITHIKQVCKLVGSKPNSKTVFALLCV
ncbi:hypothetical protein HanRHA438_Chr02g0054821 [Helianthus annuus]|nr:hypothetical protein HanRHA438_Chr02g0054821 [Helianthus annuus]